MVRLGEYLLELGERKFFETILIVAMDIILEHEKSKGTQLRTAKINKMHSSSY